MFAFAINAASPAINSTGRDEMLSSGDSVTMDCIVDGIPEPSTIFWLFNYRSVITVSCIDTNQESIRC